MTTVYNGGYNAKIINAKNIKNHLTEYKKAGRLSIMNIVSKPITYRMLLDVLNTKKDVDLDLPVMVEAGQDTHVFNAYEIHQNLGQGDELDEGQLILSWAI